MGKFTITSTPTLDRTLEKLEGKEAGVAKGVLLDLVMYGQSFGVCTDGKYERIPLESVYKIEEEL